MMNVYDCHVKYMVTLTGFITTIMMDGEFGGEGKRSVRKVIHVLTCHNDFPQSYEWNNVEG